MKKEKQLIGRIDVADFPTFGFKDITVKVDTGAYTSSIHCKEIEEVDETLQCSFLDPTHPEYNGRRFTFKNYDITAVRSSNGSVDTRYAVRSQIILFGKTYPITLTLSARDDMRFPVLLGRKFLNGKFVVDPQLQNLSLSQKVNT